MADTETACFDLDTVALLRDVLDEAWANLQPRERETISRTILAERILKEAAKGERDPGRLIGSAVKAASEAVLGGSGAELTIRFHVCNLGRMPQPAQVPFCSASRAVR